MIRTGRATRSLASALAVALMLTGCAMNTRVIEERGGAFTETAGPWLSSSYVMPVDGGVLVFDLGWEESGRALRAALDEVGADTADVLAVFLTHSHQDHMAAWRTVRTAPFVMPAAEVAFLDGRRVHGSFLPHHLDGVWDYDRPRPGELDIEPVMGDTALVFGTDTVHVFHAPGHTPGHAAYLFRGILFIGDGVTYTPPLGFMHAKGVFTEDQERSRESLRHLWDRVAPFGPRWFCTAHAKCGPVDERLRRLMYSEVIAVGWWDAAFGPGS